MPCGAAQDGQVVAKSFDKTWFTGEGKKVKLPSRVRLFATPWTAARQLQCPIFLPFHTVHGVLKARILKWFVIPFLSGPYFVRILHHDPSIFVSLHDMAHTFIELDKAVVHVISLVCFL